MKIAAALGLVAFGLLMMAWQSGAVDETMLWFSGVLGEVMPWWWW